jgi:integrase
MSRKRDLHTTPTLSVKELAEKAREYAKSAKTPSTLRAYKSDWLQFENWCRLHRLEFLPASPDSVALYMAYLAADHTVATISRRLCSITAKHRTSGFPNSPASAHHLVVSETLRGIRRVLGTAQKGKSPLLTADIRKMVAKCPKGIRGDRDKLLILIGFAGAFRRSELARMRVQDLTIYKDGVVIDLPTSKTDQEGKGRKVGIPRGKSRITCPVRALEWWLKVTAIKSGPLLRPVSKSGRILTRALHPDSVGRLVKRAAARAGLSNIECISGHSLRSGCVSQAAKSKICTEAEIMRHTNHKTEAMVRRYIRGARVIADSPARHLGL